MRSRYPRGDQPVQDVNLSVVGMTVQAGAVWDVAGKTLSVTTTYSNIGTLKAVGSAWRAVTLPAAANAGAVTFYGTTGGLGLSGMTKFGALSFNGVGGSWTLSAAITAASVTLTAGSVTVNGNGLGVTGAVTSAVGTTLTLQGGEVVTFGSTALSGAVMYDGTANYTGHEPLVLGDAYSTLTFNGTGGQWKDSALNVSGSLTITTGTLVLADGTHAITANVSGAGTLDAHLVATGSVTVGGYLGTSGTPLATLSAPAGTLNVGSNWDVTTYTANSGTVVFTGTGTIFTSSAFYNLSKSTGGVTSYSAGIALSVGNNLTVSAGTLVLADIAGTQTVGGNVSGAAGTLDAHLVAGGHVLSVAGYVGTAGTTLANLLAPAGVLNVGGDVDIATSFTSDNGTVELSGATPANVAGLSFFNLIISKAAQAVTVTSTGGLTVTNALTLTEGTWAAGALFTHTIAGAWNSSAGLFTFTAGTSTISLSPTATPVITTKGIGTDPFYNLTLASGGSLAGALQASNNLTITAGTLTLGGFALSMGVNLTGAGALTATASEAISVGGNWNVGTFTATSSTVTFTGTGSLQAPATFYNLTIAAPANVTLQANIGINNTLGLNGTLNAGAFNITMNGALWNNVGGTFNGNTGTVTFMTAATLTINGNNTWNNFTCTVDGKTILFQHLMAQTIQAGGKFTVHPVATPIVLTTDGANASPHAPLPPALQGQWVITNNGAAPDVDNIHVSWSYATVPIITGSGGVDGGNNFQWIFSIPIVASWTIDKNNDGRIDTIRVQVGVPLINTGTEFQRNRSEGGRVWRAFGFQLPYRKYGRFRYQPSGGTTRRYQRDSDLADTLQHQSDQRQWSRRGTQHAHLCKGLYSIQGRAAGHYVYSCCFELYTSVRSLLGACVWKCGSHSDRHKQLYLLWRGLGGSATR